MNNESEAIKMESKKELAQNVTRYDVISFVEHLRRKALESIAEDNKADRLAIQRKLFLNNENAGLLSEMAAHCEDIISIQEKLNSKISDNHVYYGVKYSTRLGVFYKTKGGSFDSLEYDFLNMFSHPRLSKLNETFSKKHTETKLAYGEILAKLRGMRSPKKMGEYLLSMGFDISKIEPKEPAPPKPKEQAPAFTKEILFPCLKD